MQTITTRYSGPTDTRGACIVARTASGQCLRLPYPHELDTTEAHASAALALARRLGWRGAFVMGGTKDGYAFVLSNGEFFNI